MDSIKGTRFVTRAAADIEPGWFVEVPDALYQWREVMTVATQPGCDPGNDVVEIAFQPKAAHVTGRPLVQYYGPTETLRVMRRGYALEMCATPDCPNRARWMPTTEVTKLGDNTPYRCGTCSANINEANGARL